MGSKPCPVCGTLNSVTATVCHKCGSLMRETPRPPSGGGAVMAGIPRRPGIRGTGGSEGPAGPQASPDDTQGAQATDAGTTTIPRRVFSKPATPQPVVQKRVIKKPVESQEGEGSESQSESSGENPPQDEL